jgi:hypothetical protein
MKHASGCIAIRDTIKSTVLAAATFASFALPATHAIADDDVAPAPPSIGADIPLTYFGPAPSSVQKELIGPYQLMKSGKIDQEASTIELPLYKGKMADGRAVWYILTDTTDAGNAAALGINYSSKIAYTDVGRAVRKAKVEKDLELVFESGTVDFKPERKVKPGDAPNFFPPKIAEPGSVGDQDYSPLVKLTNAGGHIYNAPIVAFDVDAEALNKFCKGKADHSITHDKVAAICPEKGTVTISLTAGFSFSRPVLYLSTEASNPVVATLEGATLAPGLQDVKSGADDSFLSAVERIFVFVNGPTGKDNPQRQGLDSALSDGRSPLNVLGGIPTIATDYSPLWDVNPGVWTKQAIEKGYRSRLTEEFAILGMAEKGFLTGLDGKPFGSVGFIVNCPIVWRFL